jgi:multisubunit Na+/H+ antiporter MnhB subunit
VVPGRIGYRTPSRLPLRFRGELGQLSALVVRQGEYVARALPAAHGRNIVNVILVDFRALDTLGEITVLAGAALAAIALIRGVPLAGSGSRAWGAAAGVQSLILHTAMRLLVSLMLLFSVFLLLRGHNEPGGGFIGGLIAATAFVLYSIADSPAAVRRTLRVDPRVIAAAGLGFGVLAGLLAAPAAAPFLTGLWTVIEDFHVGTPLIFDVGVYLAVIGSVLTVVLALERES